MKRLCIFCGEKPNIQTKEHVLPQWLIKITGRPKRKTLITIKDGKKIEFPWMNFTFPACDTCNSKYSYLESRVQHVINQLLNNKELTQSNIVDLLDWFDKIRVGIWLGQATLKERDFTPNFYIDQRVKISDRFLIISRSIEEEKGLTFTGTESLAFLCSPTCFSLTINHLTFINYSSAFLLSKNMGFPYLNPIPYINSKIEVEIEKISKGLDKITCPLIPTKIMNPSIKIYQTIFKVNGVDKSVNEDSMFSVSNYLKDNSIEYSSSYFISKPLIIKDSGSSYFGFLDSIQKISLELEVKHAYPKTLLLQMVAIIVFEHQNYEFKRVIGSLSTLPETEKTLMTTNFQKIIEFNQHYIDDITNEVSSYATIHSS